MNMFLKVWTGQASALAALLSFFLAPVIRFASQDTHMFEQFTDNVNDLLGEHPAHSILAHMCEEESGAGKGKWINGMSAADSDDATSKALTDKDTLKEYQQLAAESQTWANFQKTLTPFNDVSKMVTWSAPQLVEWGHSFDEDEEWQHLADPKGSVVNVGIRKIFKERDAMFLAGATAATVSRKETDNETLHSVALPASQTLDDLTYADVDVDSLPSMICEKFDNVWYAKGSPIYCAISATLARHFRKNSRDQIHSTDFVRSYEHFMQGTIPDIDGVTFVVLPQSMMNSIVGAGAVDSYVAWVPQAIKRVMYSGFKTSTSTQGLLRDTQLVYMREKEDFKRIDDLGVVVGDIVAAE
jgi:hypothetical protein